MSRIYTIMKKIFRSQDEKKIAGICGGLGEYLDVDPTFVRLGVIFLGLITAIVPLIITYLIGWAIIPEKANLNEPIQDAVAVE